MDFKYAPLATLVLLGLCILEISKHNKLVRDTWPDESDPRQSDMRSRFTISYVAHGLLLVYTVLLFLYQLITGKLI